MTIFPPEITRFSDWATVYLLREKRYYDSAELENLSDRSLEDIGLEPPGRDFDAVKPFWMP
jgi:uncharacterized protein YjiS (DUF1127 family)